MVVKCRAQAEVETALRQKNASAYPLADPDSIPRSRNKRKERVVGEPVLVVLGLELFDD